METQKGLQLLKQAFQNELKSQNVKAESGPIEREGQYGLDNINRFVALRPWDGSIFGFILTENNDDMGLLFKDTVSILELDQTSLKVLDAKAEDDEYEIECLRPG